MSMTKEEIIKELEKTVAGAEILTSLGYGEVNEYLDIFRVALSALRPITREQVEKTKAVFCQPCVGDFEQDTWRCSKCFVQEFGDVRGINFCPHCGAPMTDEAVETIMKRMEEMRND